MISDFDRMVERLVEQGRARRKKLETLAPRHAIFQVDSESRAVTRATCSLLITPSHIHTLSEDAFSCWRLSRYKLPDYAPTGEGKSE